MQRSPSVGIIGAGQLARMMAQAAIPLDIRIVLLAASPTDGAAQVVPNVVIGSPADPDALKALADQVDVLTFDHELVEPDLLASLQATGVQVWPSASTMALAQNKRRQRSELGAAGYPMPRFADINTADDARAFGAIAGWPYVLKASRGGYDGRGVWMVSSPGEAEIVFEDASKRGIILLAEERLPLDLEVAVLVARRLSGQMATYPPVETVQQDGICRVLRVPARIGNSIAAQAEDIARDIAQRINLVGIMAIEFFVSRSKLFVNELAPRPHNSGHWTIEGAVTSQFEQHLRAVLDWPLGSTEPTGKAVVTLNLLGEGDGHDPRRFRPAALMVPGTHLHLYGKDARPGRKVGHITVVGDNPAEIESIALAASESLFGRGTPGGSQA